MHEANTFAVSVLDAAALDAVTIAGSGVTDAHARAHTAMAGFLALASEAGGDVEVVPLRYAAPTPCGPMTRGAFDGFVARLVADLLRHGPWDGVLLALHGAAVVHGLADADAVIAATVREAVGPLVPIGVVVDLHANLSLQLAAVANAIVAYRTNPHVDARERGLECARIVAGAAAGDIEPVSAIVRPPACVEVLRQGTNDEPMHEIMAAVEAAGRRPGILAASFTMGYPWADVPQLGVAVVVVADGRSDLADAVSRDLAAIAWSLRDGFRGHGTPVEQAVAAATSHASGDRPLLLLDMGDNIGGGAPGDSVVLLRALRDAGVDGVLAVVVDAAAVAACRTAGTDGGVALAIGGSVDPRLGSPLPFQGTVLALSDGRFEEPAARHGGQRFFDAGPTAAVRDAHSTTVVLTSRAELPASLAQLEALGIEVSRFRVVIAKGVHSPRAAYEPVCGRVVFVDTPGTTTASVERLDLRARRRPMYPFEQDAAFVTEAWETTS